MNHRQMRQLSNSSRSSIGTYGSRVSFYDMGPAVADIQSYRVKDKRLFSSHWETTRWVANSEQSECFNCARKFNLFCRYHHCRSCGNCICYQCSTFKPLPCFGYTKARVCKYCCGVRNIEVQVDTRMDGPVISTAGTSTKSSTSPNFAYFSKSKEHRHQLRSVKNLVKEGIFGLIKFELRSDEFAVSHQGVTNTRAVDVKCFRRWLCHSKDHQELVLKEIHTLRILHHPNIARIIRTNIQSAQNAKLPEFPFIMTEHARFGTLDQFLMDKFVDGSTEKIVQRTMDDWHLIIRILVQLVGILKHLDQVHQIMHNDVHCGKILIFEDKILDDIGEPATLLKLCDFSNSRPSDRHTSPLKPIPTHRAPEIWQNTSFDVSSDVFSLGQTIAQILLVKTSNFMYNYFSDGVAVVLGISICNGVLPPIGREKSAVGLELADIVRDCWQEQFDRPSFDALENQLINLETRYFPGSIGRRPSRDAGGDMSQYFGAAVNASIAAAGGNTTPKAVLAMQQQQQQEQETVAEDRYGGIASATGSRRSNASPVQAVTTITNVDTAAAAGGGGGGGAEGEDSIRTSNNNSRSNSRGDSFRHRSGIRPTPRGSIILHDSASSNSTNNNNDNINPPVYVTNQKPAVAGVGAAATLHVVSPDSVVSAPIDKFANFHTRKQKLYHGGDEEDDEDGDGSDSDGAESVISQTPTMRPFATNADINNGATSGSGDDTKSRSSPDPDGSANVVDATVGCYDTGSGNDNNASKDNCISSGGDVTAGDTATVLEAIEAN
mmetsp:Transcript_31629/g.52841  ORF Transcript_31629/g.52841 Transcript_31629/m.52841 type:complete len:776 (+) Transcript_31629:80-2407(+)